MTDKKRPQSRKLVTQKVGAVDKRRRKRGLTVAVRTAIDAIVYDRSTRQQACEKASITERALYLALEKAEVAAYFNAAVDLLRRGERAANIHRLTELRDQNEARNAAVAAIRTLEALEDTAQLRAPAGGSTPGVTIRIVSAPAPPPMIDVDVTPTIDSQPLPNRVSGDDR